MKTQKDPYAPYYSGNYFGQQERAKSMVPLCRFFKDNGVNKVLDFYCGTGRNAIFLSKEGFDVYGFDRSRFALKVARKKQKDVNSKVKFKCHELDGELPYKDSMFDAVIIVRALYQAKLKTIRDYVREIGRITKPGGYVYLESNQNFRDWHTKEHRKKVRRVGLRTYQYKDNGSFYHFFTEKEIRALFRSYKTVRFYFKNGRFYVLMRKPAT